MCCAMTSQHLVALPFPSCTEPRCPALLQSAGGAVALQNTQKQGGTGMMMTMMMPPLSQDLCIPISRVTCAPLTFCFSYAAVLYLAGCPGMLLSLASQLLIRGKAPSRTKSESRHLTRLSCWSENHRLKAQAQSKNDVSPYRPPKSVQNKNVQPQ